MPGTHHCAALNMYTVYGMRLSGNCHKVRMVLEHLGIPYGWQEISVMDGETRTPEFLARNPAGKVPVLEWPDGRLMWESGAIIQYLANGSALWPDTRFEQADVLKWMFFEQYSHEPNIAVARFIRMFLPPDHPRRRELPALHESGRAALAVMEQHLGRNPFFVAGRPTIADVALFAYTHAAEDGGFDLSSYPAVREWLCRMLEQPGVSRISG